MRKNAIRGEKINLPSISGSQNGFVLAATLWILAAITLSAGFFSLWTQKTLDMVQQTQQNLQGEIDMSSTRSVILYLLGTQRMTLAGLTIPESEDDSEKALNPLNPSAVPLGGEIFLDDRPCQGVGTAYFSIQDEGGLMGLNAFSPDRLERLLGLLGVPAPHRGPMTDKLLDYTDMDDLHRLNGAEADEYERQKLPHPPNRRLLSSWEAGNILTWKDEPGLWRENALPRLTTVARGGAINLNTAPKQILKIMADVDENVAQRLIAAREKKAFPNVREFAKAAGLSNSPDPMSVTFFSSSHLRISFWHSKALGMREIHIQLTPQANGKAPWRTDYELFLPFFRTYENIQTISITAFTAPLFSGSE